MHACRLSKQSMCLCVCNLWPLLTSIYYILDSGKIGSILLLGCIFVGLQHRNYIIHYMGLCSYTFLQLCPKVDGQKNVVSGILSTPLYGKKMI